MSCECLKPTPARALHSVGGRMQFDQLKRPEFVRRCQMDATRRALLGAAALGASGLALMRDAAGAGASDHGNSGDGGYARKSVQLPPGAKVAYHDPKDIEALPDFKYSLH